LSEPSAVTYQHVVDRHVRLGVDIVLADRGDGIAEHVKVGRLDVEALGGVSLHEQRPGEVRGKPNHRDEDHDVAFDDLRMEKPEHRLVAKNERHRDEGCRIDERGEDVRSLESEGVPLRIVPSPQPNRNIADRDRSSIAEALDSLEVIGYIANKG